MLELPHGNPRPKLLVDMLSKRGQVADLQVQRCVAGIHQ